MNGSLADCRYLRWTQYSEKYESYNSFRGPKRGSDFLTAGVTSAFNISVWAPVSDTNWTLWLAIMNVAFSYKCAAVGFPAVWVNCCSWQDPLFNDGNECWCCPDRSWTVVKKHLIGDESRSMPPNTHTLSTLLPQWYFRFPSLLTSISTTFPGPPIGSLCCSRTTVHTCTSRQKL